MKDKKWIYFLTALTILICLPILSREIVKLDTFAGVRDMINQSSLIKSIGKWSANFLFIGLVTSISFVMLKKLWHIAISILVTIALAYLLMEQPLYMTLIGVFIPTLIHVYVFTGLFMLYGALKSKSKLGYLSVLLLILVIVIIVNASVDPKDFILSEATKANYGKSTFSFVNVSLAKFLSVAPANKPFSLLSEVGVKIQIFVAFAYTYHYLNWFSKTSIIKWHKVNKKQFIIIAVLWTSSVGLYYYDYRLGFMALLFLSMLHVLYEFPLNYVSIRGIFQELFMQKK